MTFICNSSACKLQPVQGLYITATQQQTRDSLHSTHFVVPCTLLSSSSPPPPTLRSMQGKTYLTIVAFISPLFFLKSSSKSSNHVILNLLLLRILLKCPIYIYIYIVYSKFGFLKAKFTSKTYLYVSLT